MPSTDPAAPHGLATPDLLLTDAAATLDGAGRVVAWNAAAATRFALSSAEAVGTPFDGLVAATDPLAVRLRLEDGRTLLVWPSPSTSPSASPAPGPVGPDEVLLAKARALEFIAGPVQHDLANPLNALMLFGAMVRLEGAIPADMTDQIPAVAEAAERTYRLARTMLDVTGRRPFGPQPLRVAKVADEVLELLGYLLTDVDVTVDVPETLPAVEADPANLRLALLLVMVNAIRALGGRKARGRLLLDGHIAEDGTTVDLVVGDSSPPVASSERAHLFDVTAAAAGAIRANGDLAAARALLRKDGGDVRYEVDHDGANRLVLVVPQVGGRHVALANADPSRVVDADGAEVDAAEVDAAEVEAGSVTVLVCDDEDSIRVLIIRVLERAGVRAVGAGSGQKALAVLAAERVGLVMADHHMPGMSGTELYLAAIQVQPELAGRFVLMSGDAAGAELVAFAREHGLRVLAKPFDLALVPRIARELAGRPGRPG